MRLFPCPRVPPNGRFMNCSPEALFTSSPVSCSFCKRMLGLSWSGPGAERRPARWGLELPLDLKLRWAGTSGRRLEMTGLALRSRLQPGRAGKRQVPAGQGRGRVNPDTWRAWRLRGQDTAPELVSEPRSAAGVQSHRASERGSPVGAERREPRQVPSTVLGAG